jgi:hypothetical protein
VADVLDSEEQHARTLALTYRFDGTRGVVRYHFRIRVPPEAGYPFALGGSPTAFVTVRGP